MALLVGRKKDRSIQDGGLLPIPRTLDVTLVTSIVRSNGVNQFPTPKSIEESYAFLRHLERRLSLFTGPFHHFYSGTSDREREEFDGRSKYTLEIAANHIQIRWQNEGRPVGTRVAK